MGDYCKYPQTCGLGADCSECMSAEINRLRSKNAELREQRNALEDCKAEIEITEELHKRAGSPFYSDALIKARRALGETEG